MNWTDLLQIQYFFISGLKGKLTKPKNKSGLFARVICKGQHSRSLQSLPGTLASKEFAAFFYFSSPAQAPLSLFDPSQRIYFKNHKAQVWRTSTFSLYPQKVFASSFCWQGLNSASNSTFESTVWLWARYFCSFPCSCYVCLFCLIISKAGIVSHDVLIVLGSSEALISKARAFGYFPNIKYLLLSASVSLAQNFYPLLKPSRWEKMVSSKSCTVNVISLSTLPFLLSSDPLLMS